MLGRRAEEVTDYPTETLDTDTSGPTTCGASYPSRRQHQPKNSPAAVTRKMLHTLNITPKGKSLTCSSSSSESFFEALVNGTLTVLTVLCHRVLNTPSCMHCALALTIQHSASYEVFAVGYWLQHHSGHTATSRLCPCDTRSATMGCKGDQQPAVGAG
jgi:hypothetical protein